MPTYKKPEIVGGQKKAVASAKGKVELNTNSDKKSGGKNELPNKTTTDATANKKGPKGKQQLGLQRKLYLCPCKRYVPSDHCSF